MPPSYVLAPLTSALHLSLEKEKDVSIKTAAELRLQTAATLTNATFRTVVNVKGVFLTRSSHLTASHRCSQLSLRYTISGNCLFLVNKATQRNHQFLLNTYQTKSGSNSKYHPPPLTVESLFCSKGPCIY